MSRRKLAKAKARRASKARAVQAAKHEAIEAKVALTAEKPQSRIRRMFSIKGLREGLLTFGAVAGVFCILLAVASFTFGIKPIIFRSGSMSPAIQTGALAISQTVEAKDLAVGDIVTVKTDAGVRVTHRVKDLTFTDGKASMVLKGDANKTPDDHVYVVQSADRVLFDIPKAGYVVSWLSGPTGIFAGGLLAGLLLLTAFGPGTRNQRKPGARKLFGISVATLTVGLISTGVSGSTNTQAYFTNAADLTSGTFTAGSYGTPPAPTGVTCTAGTTAANTVTISWNTVPGATNYRLTRTDGPTTNAATTSRVLTGTNNSSGSASVQAQIGAGPLSPSSASVSYTFGNGNNKAPACN